MKYVSLLFLILFIATDGGATGAPPTRPAGEDETASALTAPIRFFQSYLSGADGHRCPMTPSCSSYALQAVKRHGFLKGWIMATDRLMRCGRDELRRCETVTTPAGIRCRDTVDANDVWRP